jgi:hypothetical protein
MSPSQVYIFLTSIYRFYTVSNARNMNRITVENTLFGEFYFHNGRILVSLMRSRLGQKTLARDLVPSNSAVERSSEDAPVSLQTETSGLLRILRSRALNKAVNTLAVAAAIPMSRKVML